jgi:uncharacterized protein (DUF1330 family)
MAFINPTPEQFAELKKYKDEGPIVMVNLLKFKPDGGKERYAQYTKVAHDIIVNKLYGRIVYRGKALSTVIGEGDWDEVLLVEYPSISAFFQMQEDSEFREALPFRTDALLDSRLYFTKITG